MQYIVFKKNKQKYSDIFWFSEIVGGVIIVNIMNYTTLTAVVFCALESVTSSWWTRGVSLSDLSLSYRGQEVKAQRLRGSRRPAG